MNISISKRLKEARKYNKITIETACKELSICKAALINYEKGLTSPNIDLLEKMCLLYKVSPNYIILGTNDYETKLYNSLSKRAFNLLDLLIEKDIIYDQFNKKIIISNKKLKEIFIYCNCALISDKMTKLEIIDCLLKYIDVQCND